MYAAANAGGASFITMTDEKRVPMRIYVDADAFPNALKEILWRAVRRTGIPALLVACQYVRVPEDPLLESIEIATGPDSADDYIVDLVAEGDLVVTADIPLAARVVKKNATAIDPRGTLYTGTNVFEKLAARNLLADLRADGIIAGGPPGFGKKDCQAFANSLDTFLTRARSHQG